MKRVIKLCSLLLLFSMVLIGCGAAQEIVTESEVPTTVEVATESVVAVETTETDTVEAENKAIEEKEDLVNKVADEELSDETMSETETEEVVTESVGQIVVTPFEEPKTMYATIALNMRRGPSTDYEVVGHLAMAQETVVVGQADTGWYQVMSGGEAVFVSNKYMSETKVEVPVQPAPIDQATAQQTATPAQAAVAPAGVIMVGDSRCVQMQAAVGGGGCSWICENSKEYTWFSEKAIPRFDQYVGKGTKVVINMGVNDPEHYQQYAELVNVKAAEWAARGAKTYFVSVNPVWENPYTTQEQVDTFNANVPGLLSGVTWIDTASWLATNGYRLVDGLHFDDPTSVNIFNLIMGSL